MEDKNTMNRVTNKVFAATDKTFLKICEMLNIKPTKRQTSKFRMGRGLAFRGK